MKFSLAAAQFLSPAFAAAIAIASPSSVYVTEELAKNYDNHRDIHAAAASRAVPSPSRNLDSIHATSKSSKSSVSCPPEPTPDVQCGSTYVDSTVILGQNLICTEGRGYAALLLKGKKALLDCQGYTISQNTNSSAAAMDDTEDLFFVAGVILKDGATMVNCNIQKFVAGGGVVNGGEILNSDFSLNRDGVEIVNRAANTVSKVANSEFYNNYNGLKAFQYKEDNAKVMIEDVVSENNKREGMLLTGTGITVNNADIKNNLYGFGIGGVAENNVEITLAGDITVTNNKYGFDTTVRAQGTVYVTGDFNLNRNEEVGLEASSPNLTIAVGGSYSGKSGKSGSGSLTACDNGQYDIFNNGENGGPSTFEGSDYTCETTDGPGIPKCEPCHPGCSESSQD